MMMTMHCTIPQAGAPRMLLGPGERRGFVTEYMGLSATGCDIFIVKGLMYVECNFLLAECLLL